MHGARQFGGEEHLEDARLARLAATGDPDAIAALYDRHGPTCYRIALRVTANPALAEEVVQEAFLALWHGRSFRAGLGTLRSFLVALAHHKAVDAVRRETARDRHEDTYGRRQAAGGDPAADPEAALLGALRDGEVRGALLALSPPQRETLVLAYFAGHTQREIAELTGVPLGTVKTRTLAGMRAIRARLAADAGAAKEKTP